MDLMCHQVINIMFQYSLLSQNTRFIIVIIIELVKQFFLNCNSPQFFLLHYMQYHSRKKVEWSSFSIAVQFATSLFGRHKGLRKSSGEMIYFKCQNVQIAHYYSESCQDSCVITFTITIIGENSLNAVSWCSPLNKGQHWLSSHLNVAYRKKNEVIE